MFWHVVVIIRTWDICTSYFSLSLSLILSFFLCFISLVVVYKEGIEKSKYILYLNAFLFPFPISFMFPYFPPFFLFTCVVTNHSSLIYIPYVLLICFMWYYLRYICVCVCVQSNCNAYLHIYSNHLLCLYIIYIIYI